MSLLAILGEASEVEEEYAWRREMRGTWWVQDSWGQPAAGAYQLEATASSWRAFGQVERLDFFFFPVGSGEEPSGGVRGGAGGTDVEVREARLKAVSVI